MNLSATFKSLCLPSKVYLVLAFIGIIVSVLFPTISKFSLLFQLIHLVYIIFWTWILNLICKAGYKVISWILVLAPFVLVFLLFTFLLGEAIYKEEKIARRNKTAPVIILNK